MQRPWKSATYCLAPYGLLNLLSYRTQDLQGWYYPHWAEISPMDHQLRKCPIGLPTDLYYGSIFSIDVSSYLITLVYIKLT